MRDSIDVIIDLLVMFIVISVIGMVFFLVTVFSSKKLKSSERIEPEIELIIKDNKVDTVFIYKTTK